MDDTIKVREPQADLPIPEQEEVAAEAAEEPRQIPEQDTEEKLKQDRTFREGRRVKNRRLILVASVALLLLAALFLWLEVFTVEVYMVTNISNYGPGKVEPYYTIEREYNGSGNLTSHVETTYYDGDILVSSTHYYYAGDLLTQCNTPDTTTYYKYDSDDRLESIYVYDDNSVDYYCKCTCDEDGNVIEEVYYRAEGEAYSSNPIELIELTGQSKTYSYDEDGRLVEECYYNPNGMYAQTSYQYDEGQLVSFSDGDGGFACDYDSNGRITEKRTYESGTIDDWGREFSRTEYVYDSLGHLCKEKTYKDGELVSVVNVTCDMSGNPISYTYEDGNRTTKIYERFRMTMSEARELQEKFGDDYIIIDTGWF